MAILSDKQKWMLVSTGSAFAAAGLVRLAAEGGWKRVTGYEPPKNPAAPDVSWTSALVWGVGTGVLISVARVVAERLAAKTWTELGGTLPKAVRRQRASV